MARTCASCKVSDLRHRITFEKQVRVADGAGGWTETWSAERTCSAKVEPLSGRAITRGERFGAMQLEHPVTHRITVRYSAAVAGYHRDGAPRRRIDLRGRKLKIVAIVNLEEANQWLEIGAIEGTAA